MLEIRGGAPYSAACALISVWFGLTSSHGVPLVKPACADASHCIGVRALSRPIVRSACSTASGSSPAAIASA